jgi:hypothetical protein
LVGLFGGSVWRGTYLKSIVTILDLVQLLVGALVLEELLADRVQLQPQEPADDGNDYQDADKVG